MEITEAVKTCLSKSFKLDGRASRSEYWYFVLFQICLYFVGIVIMSLARHFNPIADLALLVVCFYSLVVYFCLQP